MQYFHYNLQTLLLNSEHKINIFKKYIDSHHSSQPERSETSTMADIRTLKKRGPYNRSEYGGKVPRTTNWRRKEKESDPNTCRFDAYSSTMSDHDDAEDSQGTVTLTCVVYRINLYKENVIPMTQAWYNYYI